MAQESLQAAPRLTRLPVQEMALATPVLSLAPGPGPNLGLIPIVAHADTIADLAPARGPIIADLTVGPTAESADAGAIAAHPCPTVAGTLETALIQTQTVAWEYLA